MLMLLLSENMWCNWCKWLVNFWMFAIYIKPFVYNFLMGSCFTLNCGPHRQCCDKAIYFGWFFLYWIKFKLLKTHFSLVFWYCEVNIILKLIYSYCWFFSLQIKLPFFKCHSQPVIKCHLFCSFFFKFWLVSDWSE